MVSFHYDRVPIELWHEGAFTSKDGLKYVGGQHTNLDKVTSMCLTDIENLMKGLGYTEVLSIAYNPPKKYMPIGMEWGLEFVETEEQCKTIIEEAINHGFLKIYVEAMIVQASVGENHINGVGNMAVNADDVVINDEIACNGSDEDSLPSNQPDSSDDEHVAARQNLKAFKETTVDNANGFGGRGRSWYKFC